MTAKFAVSIVLNPILCAIGIYLSWLIIRTINRNQKELKDNLYVFMSLNAKFNCAFYIFNLMSECVSVDGIYCSAVRQFVWAQYFEILIVNYLGSVVKMCSSVSYLFLTLNRYMLIGKDHNRFIEKLSGLSMQKVYIMLGLSSCGLSLVKIFEYELNTVYNNKDFPFLRGTETDIDGEVEHYSTSSSRQITNLLVLYDLFNVFLFAFFNSILELAMLVKFRREISEKSKRNLVSHGTWSINSVRLKRKDQMNERAERRVITMVVLNGVLNFVLRLPEVSSLFYFISYSYFATKGTVIESSFLLNLCIRSDVCHLIADISNVFFILSTSSNFFVFFFFNKKFWLSVHK